MSRVLEEMCREVAEETAFREKTGIARQMLDEGIRAEVVARCTGLALDIVMELAGTKSA